MAAGAEGVPGGRPREGEAWRLRLESALPGALLAIAVAGSGALLLFLGSQLTFLLDDWEVLLYRPGFTAEAVLAPHGEHIVVGPVLVYKALLATFGMSSAQPFRVVSTTLFLLSAVLLFAYLRRRVGDWLGLCGAVVVLFLGPAWEDLLWPFQIGFFAGMSGGLAMLLCLEREDRRGDLLACLALTFSLAFSSLGLPFAVGGALHVLRGRDRWRRAYVVLVPVGLYAVWWLGWGHTAESALSPGNVATTPAFAVKGVAAAFASLLGLTAPGRLLPDGTHTAGRLLAVAVVLLAAWRLRRWSRLDWSLMVVVSIAASFWILAGLNEKAGRAPEASRYQYVGAVLVLLVAAQLFRGARASRAAVLAAGVATVAIVASNVYGAREHFEDYRRISQLERADLAAVEIARDSVEPGFVLASAVAGTAYVHVEAWAYLSAVDAFGSPAYTEDELRRAPPAARAAADRVLVGALRVQPRPIRAPRTLHGCTALPSRGTATAAIALPRAGAVVQAGEAPIAGLALRRFATEGFPIDLPVNLPPGQAAAIRVPADRAAAPWRMRLRTTGAAAICGLGG